MLSKRAQGIYKRFKRLVCLDHIKRIKCEGRELSGEEKEEKREKFKSGIDKKGASPVFSLGGRDVKKRRLQTSKSRRLNNVVTLTLPGFFVHNKIQINFTQRDEGRG